MYIDKLIGERVKDAPADAKVKSHILLMRAGYIKQVANGIYTMTTLGKRVAANIENIIREEMNAIDGQEVSFPVVLPRELWDESGRYQSVGSELAKFKDRADRDMLLAMTHEEAAVHLVRGWVNSYNQLPFCIYQFQTKFRDEARSRAGLIRTREFVMKDGYSFHNTQADLEAYYAKVLDAYDRIFKRIGLKNFISVKSDTGMMGGAVAHEFMLLSAVGEDTLALCPHCDYKANMEVAECDTLKAYKADGAGGEPLKEVFTAEAHEIKDVARFLKVQESDTLKAVAFKLKGGAGGGVGTVGAGTGAGVAGAHTGVAGIASGAGARANANTGGVIVFLRGDLEVNEAKLRKLVKDNITPWDTKSDGRLSGGNIGPVGLNLPDTKIIFDLSVKGRGNLAIGANKPNYHYTGFNLKRDYTGGEVVFADVAKVVAEQPCVKCGHALTLANGIEIGNIFQLGTKYTKAMNMTVASEKGEAINPIMGCYGIGIGRAIASVAEENGDERGLKWNAAVAPFKVHICALRSDEPLVLKKAEAVYKKLTGAKIETLFDGRNVSAGIKFADADLIGAPIRLVISPKSLEGGGVELSMRGGAARDMIKYNDVLKAVRELLTIDN
jgi:prolyl-tRNA synthetase